MKKVKDALLKKAVIAGASAALKSKERNPRYSDEDALEEVIRNSKGIINEIDKD